MIRVASCEPGHVEQLAALVSAHVACALPGAAVFSATIAARLERDPGEFVLDPWVETRDTLVTLVRDRVVAAGQLWRFADEPHVSDSYRGAAELRWFCFGPPTAKRPPRCSTHAIEQAGPISRFYPTGDLPGVLA
jgi:hypothetical protein